MSAEPKVFHDAGLWTIPNLISLLRIAGIPVVLWLLLERDDSRNAALLLITIGFTDFLDGALARKLGQTSEIGKFLDPLADRLAIFAAVVGGLIADILPAWFGWSLLGREVLVGAGALYLLTRLKTNVTIRQMGKTATAIVYAAIPAFYLASAGIAPDFWHLFGNITGAVGLVLYLTVAWLYFEDIRKSTSRRRTLAE